MKLDTSQENAVQLILGWAHASEKGWISLAGCGGSGKTSCLTSFILPELTLNQKLRVAVATPTARAARVLSSKLRDEVKAQLRHLGTIHSLLYNPIFDEFKNIIGWQKKEHLEDIDILVIDECSMVDETMEQDLLSFECPIIAVGDPYQLSPINGVSTWMDSPSVLLDQVHRQALNSPILRLATYVRKNGRLPLDLATYEVNQYLKLSSALPILQNLYESIGKNNVAVACHTNYNRVKINEAIHSKLFTERSPTVGSQVVCLKNNKHHGVYNGDRGILTYLESTGSSTIASVQLETGESLSHMKIAKGQFGLPKVMELEDKQIVLLDLGYCLTCHRLQGSQFSDVFITKDMPKSSTDFGRWMYTAVSRATNKLHFISRS